MAKPAIRTDKLTRDFGSLRGVDALTLEVPEEQESLKEQMRTYNSGQLKYVDVLEQWYVYEKSGLVEKIQ